VNRTLTSAIPFFQIGKNFISVTRRQFACVEGVNPPFRFCCPGNFPRLLFGLGKRTPQHVNQPGALRGGQSENFVLNSSDTHAKNLQPISHKANRKLQEGF
jgi:hypothetical protein